MMQAKACYVQTQLLPKEQARLTPAVSSLQAQTQPCEMFLQMLSRQRLLVMTSHHIQRQRQNQQRLWEQVPGLISWQAG